ncbi:hypothetical protein [Gordonia sp. ABSL49_1]|uniref:hypothetical protein n=1 Tax=Gordonia sp. ABSL49_1 TaxID=2920941 RepID=UPI001F0E7298|nr:hypothetical protein [Gordonia sp. ABSL49_1]MCH5645699.1 hypothetical protein [Gordonia sp. ABSL49_1]
MKIHVDYNAEHQMMTFGDTNGEPILYYRSVATVQHATTPDGWVLATVDGEEWITGVTGLVDVDKAISAAQAWLSHR